MCARLICNESKYCHITPLLVDLHWLPLKFKIEFKIVLIFFKIFRGLPADLYLTCLQISNNQHGTRKRIWGSIHSRATISENIPVNCAAGKRHHK